MSASTDVAVASSIGRYVLYGQIAAGGMATIHVGRLRGEEGFARTIAIKRMHTCFARDPTFVAMFRDEARLAARVRHPNVLPTLDVVNEGGELFLVMEYVHGESLSRLLKAVRRRRGVVPTRIAAAILVGALHGLHAAHEARDERGEALAIVHRDVSPQNVLVGVDGLARVLDFGVAKAAVREQTTRDGQIKGKPSYMAPEQIARGEVTRRTDIYAASVVLWEMLTLRRLFVAQNEIEALLGALHGSVTAPSELAPHVSPELDAIVLRGLARDPAERWASARQMAVALERAVGVASPSEVGDWVDWIAREELAARASLLAEVERASVEIPVEVSVECAVSVEALPSSDLITEISTATSSIVVLELEPHPTRESLPRAVLVGMMLASAFMIVVMTLRPRPMAAAHFPAPAALESAPPVSGASALDMPALDMPAPFPSSSASVTPEPCAKALPIAPVAPPVRHEARALASECDPPFTRDPRGHKHYKVRCL